MEAGVACIQARMCA